MFTVIACANFFISFEMIAKIFCECIRRFLIIHEVSHLSEVSIHPCSDFILRVHDVDHFVNFAFVFIDQD